MSNFDSVMADDAANAFAGSGDFGESLVYVPHNGSPRTIWGQVTRLGIQPRGRDDTPKEVVLIEVPNSATLGILATSANFGKDKVTLAVRKGGTAVSMWIHMPGDGAEWHDAGMIRVEAY